MDTTLSQAYYGTAYEYPSIIQAVDATDGEVVMKDGKIVETVFSSNSGGMTADSTEVWGNRNDLFLCGGKPWRLLVPGGAEILVSCTSSEWCYRLCT